MRIKVTLGDMFTEEQMRALTKGLIAEQKHGSRTPRSRQSDDRLDGVCAKVQWIRHKKQRGEWKNRKAVADLDKAIAAYESDWRWLCGTRLERGEKVFKVGQQERPPHKCSKPGNRNACVRANSGRPKGIRRKPFPIFSTTSMTGVLVDGI